MNDERANWETLKAKIKGGLIVSCQAPAGSPLARPEIIAAFAQAAEQNGAVAVRIDSPENIAVVRKAITIPIIGIYKIVQPGSEVYITPTYQSAVEAVEAGADVVAFDATSRKRPAGENLHDLYEKIKINLKVPVMADVATLKEGFFADEIGCDFVGTTLSGYTPETSHLHIEPDFELIKKLSGSISTPVIAEGRIAKPDDLRRAFECGAFAVVVGNAITGIDNQIKAFAAACPR
jgi:N-acylglucosamine-6-phosphate 2-epimerase